MRRSEIVAACSIREPDRRSTACGTHCAARATSRLRRGHLVRGTYDRYEYLAEKRDAFEKLAIRSSASSPRPETTSCHRGVEAPAASWPPTQFVKRISSLAGLSLPLRSGAWCAPRRSGPLSVSLDPTRFALLRRSRLHRHEWRRSAEGLG